MKATLAGLGALLVTAALTTAAPAQFPAYPYPGPRLAPDACGPCFYCTNCCGAIYGPNYCLLPPFPPVQGVGPNANLGQQGQGQGAAGLFNVNPFYRSPRDYFMVDDP